MLSDGTLRFAALAASLFQESNPHILLLEEVDNGIHPTRVRLLIELLKSRTRHGDTQIFITTHSPILLTWLSKDMYDCVFYCIRTKTGSSQIAPVISLPHFKELINKQPFGDLFAEGWIENSI